MLNHSLLPSISRSLSTFFFQSLYLASLSLSTPSIQQLGLIILFFLLCFFLSPYIYVFRFFSIAILNHSLILSISLSLFHYFFQSCLIILFFPPSLFLSLYQSQSLSLSLWIPILSLLNTSFNIPSFSFSSFFHLSLSLSNFLFYLLSIHLWTSLPSSSLMYLPVSLNDQI